MKSPVDAVPSPADDAWNAAGPEIRREMAKGTGWMIGARLSVQGIGFLSTLILARLLVPADFGLVALAVSFSAALEAFGDFSFDVVLIQNQRANREHYDTAWTLSLCRSVILAACLAIAGKWIAILYGDERLEVVTYWLAVCMAVSGFQNIGIVDFRKEFSFHKDLVFMVLVKAAGFAVTVPLAFVWRSYWALVAGIVASNVARVVLSYGMHGYRPRLCVVKWRELMNFSGWLILNNVSALLFGRSDTFILGKFAGAQVVGIYSIAYEIATLATANFIAPLRRAIFPGYAKLSENRGDLRNGFLDVLAAVILIGAPLAVGIGVVANPIVRVMLGAQWIDSIPVIQVLSLYGLLSVFSAGSAPVYLATGRPHYVLWRMLASIAVMIPLLIVGVQYAGSLGAAWAVTIAAAVLDITDVVLIARLLDIPYRGFLLASYRPIAAAAAMAVTTREMQVQWPVPSSTIDWSIVLASSVLVGAATYVAAVALLWLISGRPEGAERHVQVALGHALSRALRGRRKAAPMPESDS